MSDCCRCRPIFRRMKRPSPAIGDVEIPIGGREPVFHQLGSGGTAPTLGIHDIYIS